jgi:hypothetical protein
MSTRPQEICIHCGNSWDIGSKMDWRSVLRRYIAHVKANEGTDFLEVGDYLDSSDHLSKRELKELIKMRGLKT